MRTCLLTLAVATAMGCPTHPGDPTTDEADADTDADSDADADADADADTDADTDTDTGTAPAPLTCGPLEARLAGEVDGVVFDEAYPFGSISLVDATQVNFGTFGTLFLDGVARTGPEATTGWIRSPSESPAAGTWFCAEAGTHVPFEDDARYHAELGSVATVGTCEGAVPVDGTIAMCLGPSCGDGFVTSDIPGASFSIEPMFSSVSHPYGGTTAVVRVTPTGGSFVMEAVGVDPSATEPKVAGLGTAFAILPPDVEDGGALYCVGDGSVEYRIEEGGFFVPSRVELRALARLGSCPGELGGTGSLSFCANQNE